MYDGDLADHSPIEGTVELGAEAVVSSLRVTRCDVSGIGDLDGGGERGLHAGHRLKHTVARSRNLSMWRPQAATPLQISVPGGLNH